jgi:hypothetical protein
MYPDNLGEITAPRVAVSTVIIVGAMAAFAGGAVIRSFSNDFFYDGKKGRDYKKVAKRNAVLGGAMGAIAAAGILSA